MSDDLGAAGLRLEREGPIAWCVIDRPEARNALTPAMYFGIKRAVRLVNTDPDLAALIITGTGDVFAPGGDLGGRREPGDAPLPEGLGHDMLPFLAIRDSPAPVIAAVNGICQAGGLLIAMMADIAVASDRATFRVPELLRGIPDATYAAALPAHVGVAVARDLLLSARRFDAAEAQRLGVHLAGRAPRRAAGGGPSRRPTRCCRPPEARMQVKRMLNERYGDIDYQTMFWALDHSPEPREGMAAFMEKRPPSWVPPRTGGPDDAATGSSSGPRATSAPDRCGASSSTRPRAGRACTCTAPDKAGRDAGDLCGLDKVGVAATDRHRRRRWRWRPTACCTCPRRCDFDEVCRLLASGANVVTTRGEFHRPAEHGPGDPRSGSRRPARAGGTSIHSTGSSPGFITEAVPLVLTSIQRRLDRLTIEEFADLSQRNSPELLFQLMGFGQPPAAIGEGRLDARPAQLRPVAAAAGRRPRRCRSTTSRPAARWPRPPAPSRSPPARSRPAPWPRQRTIVTGAARRPPGAAVPGHLVLHAPTSTATGTCGATGWRVTVEGDAPLDVELRFPFPLERMAETSPGYTANRAVNAVPVVCAAPPGIRTTVDLPQIIAALG